MSLLATRGAMNGREISAASRMDAGLISRALRALEMRGLLAIERSDADRRVARATLTPAGMDLYTRVLPAMRRRQEDLLDALTPAERGSVFRIIDKLEMAASRPVGGAE
jgi:DNA-binding MarR family transcriptional regulator